MAETFGDALRARRKTAGLSQDALGERVGVRGGTVSRWEAGKLQPQPSHAYAVAQVFEEPAARWLMLAGWPVTSPPDRGEPPVADVKRALGRTSLKPAVRGAIGLLVQELADEHAAEWVRRFDAVVADELPAEGIRIVGAAGANPEHVAQARDTLLRIRARLFGVLTPEPR